MQDLHFNLHVIVACSPGNGIAEMLTGYLYHYAMDQATAVHFPEQGEMPAFAEKALREDGIHQWEQRMASTGVETLIIRINQAAIPTLQVHTTILDIEISIPMDSDPSLHTFRTLREEIKRIAIAVIGSRQPAFSE